MSYLPRQLGARSMKSVLTALVFSFALLTISHGPASATSVLRMSVEELCEQASHIVHARVISPPASVPYRTGKLPARERRVKVIRYLKGDGAEEISLRELGGPLPENSGASPGAMVRILGNPTFTVGDEAFLFLRRSDEGYFTLMGLAQGAFFIDPSHPHEIPRQRLQGLNLVVPQQRAQTLRIIRQRSTRRVERVLQRVDFEARLAAILDSVHSAEGERP